MRLLFILALGLFCSLGVRAQDFPEVDRRADGSVAETRFTMKGMRHFVQYHASGRVAATGAFRYGKAHGAWKQYAEDGSVLAEAYFQQGKRVGQWRFRSVLDGRTGSIRFDGDGQRVDATEYVADAVVDHRTY